MNPKWSSKFELKPNKWVFIPTKEAIATGSKIKRVVEQHWRPPSYYFHLRAGGHVEALRSHIGNDHFLRLDIQDFFGSINRTRITRSLKGRIGYSTAREYAHESTVPDPTVDDRNIIPFGFIQSQILAAICLAESALGIYLGKLSHNPFVALTVYVDDIIISTSDATLLEKICKDIEVAAKRARFTLNTKKQEGPADAITAFNILLSKGSMEVEPMRYKQFEKSLAEATNKHQREGIISYIGTVNIAQGIKISK